MRIAQLANFYGPRSGGIRTAVDALGRGYVDRGDDVLAVLPGDQDTEADSSWGHRIHLHSPVVPGSGGYRVITRLGAVRDALERFRPDVLEVHDRTTLATLAPWARRQGIATAFLAHERADGVVRAVVHGVLPGALPRVRPGNVPAALPLVDAHSRWLARSFDTLIATTGYAAAELRGVGGTVTTVPLGVDLHRFHPRHHGASTRRTLADDGEALLVMASRLSPEKRPDVAIDAVRALVARGRAVRLVCAGAGSLDRESRRRARGLPVSFLGFVSDRDSLATLLATADAVIAPGPIETFGLTALEALASGTPVVVNAASALPEVVGHAGVAAPGDPERFADAIEDILRRDGRDRRRVARARAERFPWDATVTRMRALHAAALAEAAA